MSSGVIQCPAGTISIPRGVTRLDLSGLRLSTNIMLSGGNTFQVSDAGDYLLDFSFQPSASLTDVAYTLELFDETAGAVVQSFGNSVSPTAAPPQQQFQFTFTANPIRFYSLRVNAPNGGSPNRVMQLLNNASSQLVVTLLTGGGGGGGASITPITYAALVTAIGGSTLTAGQQYIITDFATVHYINDGNTVLGTNVGSTEPLIVLATSTNTIGTQVYSVLFPQDEIRYDWNPANWLEDFSFAQAGVIIPGFKGVIFLRNDTLYANSLGYDFRNVVFRRFKTNQPAWDVLTTYNQHSIVLGSNGWIYASLVAVNLAHDPITGSGEWVKLLDTTAAGGGYWNTNATSTNSITSDPAAFADFKTFAEGAGTATYDLSVRSNNFTPFKDNVNYFDLSASILPNIVFFLADSGYYNVYGNTAAFEFSYNTFGEGFILGNNFGAVCEVNQFQGNVQYNTLGQTCTGNVVGDEFNSNTICTSFDSNYVGDHFFRNFVFPGFVQDVRFGSLAEQNKFGTMQHSRLKTGCQNNDISAMANSYIGMSFQNNVVGVGFSDNIAGDSVVDNTIGADCTINTFGDNFAFNTVAAGCSTNTFGIQCDGNTFGASFQNNTIGAHFAGNDVGPNVIALTNIPASVSGLTISPGFTTQDFAGATKITQPGNKTLLVESGGANKISYVTAGVLTFAAANA